MPGHQVATIVDKHGVCLKVHHVPPLNVFKATITTDQPQDTGSSFTAMHLNIVPDQRPVNCDQIIECIVKYRITVASSIEVKSKLLACEAVIVRVKAISHVPGSFHSFLVDFANNRCGWLSTGGVVDWLGIRKTEAVVSLEHAVHQIVLCFGFVTF